MRAPARAMCAPPTDWCVQGAGTRFRRNREWLEDALAMLLPTLPMYRTRTPPTHYHQLTIAGMPVACTAFNQALQALENGLNQAISGDGDEFDVIGHWPLVVNGQGSVDRLAATLKLRKKDVNATITSSSYQNDAIASLFEEHGGFVGYRTRCAKSKKRGEQVRGKKLMFALTRESLTWAVCPVLHAVMKEPHVLPCGHTFDKKVIRRLVRMRPRPASGVCPLCQKKFKNRDVVLNYALLDAIKWYKSLPAMIKSSIDL